MSAPRLLLRFDPIFALKLPLTARGVGAGDHFNRAATSPRREQSGRKPRRERRVDHRRRCVLVERRPGDSPPQGQMRRRGGGSNRLVRQRLLRAILVQAGQMQVLNAALFENGEKNHDVHG